MGIRIGNVNVNGQSGGVVNGGKQLKCPSCGNTTQWGDITMTNDRTVADCGNCGEKVVA